MTTNRSTRHPSPPTRRNTTPTPHRGNTSSSDGDERERWLPSPSRYPQVRRRAGAEVYQLTRLPLPGRRRWWRSWRRWLTALAWLTAVAAVAALGWLVVLAVLSLIATVTALIAWVQTHWLLCLLAALALLVLLTATGGDRRAGCGGLHCRGCRR